MSDSLPPDSEDSPESTADRPMPVPMAMGWTSVAVMLLLLTVQTSMAMRPSLQGDAVNGTFCQALSWMIVVLAIVRIHMPARALPDVTGFRRTGVGLIVLGVLVGAAMQAPANLIDAVIESRWPRTDPPSSIVAVMQNGALWVKIATAMALVAVGPAVEELLFRGVMFRALLRDRAPWVALTVTAMLFSLSHVDPQGLVPIFVCGLILGGLRMLTGSALVSLAAHAAFNASSLFEMARTGTEDSTYSWQYYAGGTTALIVLMALVGWLSRQNVEAQAAREEDSR